MQLTEDSFVGAMRRLEQIEQGRARSGSDETFDAQRMRDLEELARVCTDENERLEQALAAARHDLLAANARIEMQAARITKLESTRRSADESDPGDDVDRLPRRRVVPALIGGVALVGAFACLFYVASPRHSQAIATSASTPLAAVAPVIAPVVAPLPAVVPVAAPPAPAPAVVPVEASKPVVAAAPSAPRPKHDRHAKRHAAAKHHKATRVANASKKKVGAGCANDPLCGMF